MRNFKRSVLVAALMPLLSPTTWALGLGEMKMRSYLNEPLRAEVALLDVNGLNAEDIRIRIATAEDFSRMGVERAYFLTSVQFTVEVDDSGRGRVLLTTTEPLLEPYIDLILETRWPAGRLLREYTVLVDLPDVNRTELMASSSQTLSQIAQQITPQKTQLQAPAAQPEPRPNRDYGRNAKALPTPGERYLVEKNDTLWEIAARGRPAGASVEQTMVATVEMNPQAFNDGNINGLKAGYVLYMPAEDDIRLSNLDALSAVSQQNQDWRNGVRRQPALRVVADNELSIGAESSAERQGEGALAVTPNLNTVVSEADSLTDEPDIDDVAGADADEIDTSEMSDSTIGESTGQVAASPDLVLIQQRLSQLSDQVENMRELVTLKDEQIASLQQQLAAESASTESSVPADLVPEASDDALPWWMYVLGGVVLLGAGSAFVARRADRKVQRDMVQTLGLGVAHKISKEQIPLVKAPVDDVTEPTDRAPEVEQDGERGYGRKLHNAYAQENPIADAIAEADIYIAYGRYQQALDLLAAATKAEPGHSQGFLKMLEIYLKNDRREEAEALLPSIMKTGDIEAQLAAEAMLSDYHAPAIAAETLGELADVSPAALPETSTSRAAIAADASIDDILDFDLDAAADGKTASNQAQDALSAEADIAALDGFDGAVSDIELDLADWGDTELETTAEGIKQSPQLHGKLPPELAAVLGSDIPPPAVDHVPDDEDGELVYATEANPVETKLDLARAYLDMGDEDGARPVLEEVISEGDLHQQAQARELLLRIE